MESLAIVGTFRLNERSQEFGEGKHCHGRNQCWRYRLGAGLVSACDAHDARAGAVLWRPGSPEECALDDYAQLLHAWADQCILGAGWLLAGFWADTERDHRWLGLDRPE